MYGEIPHAQEEGIMQEAKKVKHHLVRKHNQIGTKTIKVFSAKDYAAAQSEMDSLNAQAAETNPAFRFEIITFEVK